MDGPPIDSFVLAWSVAEISGDTFLPLNLLVCDECV
jgi:hypothetical protein